ncbi:MAG TPA: C40 family peptidase [Methylomusa anaerophila]|uniref:Gamma-DL-glutamyl hydrolase n=1 Tax=Methylomusa anaerophila TaxID=1930071 RepID=A0A348AEV1_9FIRM|nr:C40 family peptidase [Methylomusa anaerophila]BBB89599.1 gamma-DL-glutamyl hydrolase precursor [Methylomusa anaerophila]HML89628.1 C40 family peptidase [Methylomusa anaerophila]
MKKLMLALFTGILLSGPGIVQAAPASGYSQFIESLDSILSGATLPVADERQVTGRTGFLAPGQAGQVLSAANELLGYPVVWGGASPIQGFDCSGLVQYVFRQAGITMPRTADLQFLVGKTVAISALQPGDLVYFTTYEPGASHVGIYMGNDKFIHTSFSKGVVAIGDMNDNYFGQRYYGAKRVL